VESVERSDYVDGGPNASRGRYYERKGKQPLSKPALSRASRHAPEPVLKRPSAKETLKIVLARLDDMKAEHSVTIDLTGKSTIGDFMVVTSGRSNVHLAAIADNLVKDLKGAGITGIRVEGLRQGDWVLIDAGDLIVHVFRPEVRSFYSLEKMWSSGRPDARRSS
jgi:ribosome-associated protein